MTNLVRKLAIATDINGVIGVDGKLLFQVPADMANFARFTRGTVMIAGRTTAQEMIDMKVPITSKRPLVVISKDNVLVHHNRVDLTNTYFAADLADAIVTATELAATRGLLGWTVIGGKTVYDQFLLPASGYELDAVYLATFCAEVLEPGAVKLAGGNPLTRLKEMLGAWRNECTGLVVSLEQAPYRRLPVSFNHLYNVETFNPAGIKLVDERLIKIEANAGSYTLPLDQIVGYVEARLSNTLQLHTSSGGELEVRLQTGRAGLNYLTHLIDQHLLYKGSK